MEGTEAYFLLFPNEKNIYIQIIPIRSIYYFKYGHIGSYFYTISRVLVTNTLFYFNGCIKHNIFQYKKLSLLEGTETYFLLFSNEKIYLYKLFQCAVYII